MLIPHITGRKKACFHLQVFVVLFIYAFGLSAQEPNSSESGADEIISEVYSLIFDEDYAQAMLKADQCLRVVEKKHGPGHPEMSGCLNAKALIFASQEQYPQAEALYLRALAIDEKASGPDSVEVADDLDALASIYEAQSRYENAKNYYDRVLLIREKALGKDALEVAEVLHSIAGTLVAERRYREAEPFYQRTVAIREKVQGLQHKDVGETISDLAGLYQELGQFAKADDLYQRAVAIDEKNLGSDPFEKVAGAGVRAESYQKHGRYAQAEVLWLRNLEGTRDILGDDHETTQKAMENLARFYLQTTQFSKAEPLYKKLLTLKQAAYGEDNESVAGIHTFLGHLYGHQGRDGLAEANYWRALTLFEKLLGTEHGKTAAALGNLGTSYYKQGKYTEAEALLKRALAINEKSGSGNTPDHAAALFNLAAFYQEKKRLEEAEPLFRRALEITEIAHGRDHLMVAGIGNRLAAVFVQQGRYPLAEAMFERAIALYEKPFGPAHPDIALVLREWAVLRSLQKRYSEAEIMQQRALSIVEKTVGNEHPLLTGYLHDLSGLYLADGKSDAALAYSKRASAILRKRYTSNESLDRSGGKLSEQRSKQAIFIHHIGLLKEAYQKQGHSESIAAEAFEISQLARASNVGQSVGQMAARFAGQGDELAILIRQQQDALDLLSRNHQTLLTMASRPAGQRDTDYENRLRTDNVELEARLDQYEQTINQQFPQYQTLVGQQPMNVAEVQSALAADEAALIYTVAQKETYAWVIRKNRIDFYTLAIDQAGIETQVSFLRSKLRPGQGKILPVFTPATSNRLYKAIFAPLEASLKDAKQVLLITDGALQGLPLGLLGRQQQDGTLQWLGERYAFSVLPSVSALRALRIFSRRQFAEKPFLGFGDPVLANVDPSDTSIIANTTLITGKRTDTSGIVDVDALRKNVSLPQTAEELRSLSTVLNASPDSVFLREQATETRVKKTDLSQYRFIAFATHGVLAGELDGVTEPGLILTPPATGTLEDDGYLGSSEVAQLKLNADWVLLSACNTAGSDGSNNAEGLSGLAKAFFYAGSRSLLVSNWPVSSTATRDLITRTVSIYAASPGIRKSDALKQASIEMAASTEHAHPFYWAAFSVVGD